MPNKISKQEYEEYEQRAAVLAVRDVVFRDFGIELTWAEKAAFRFYVNSFRKTKTRTPFADALYFFMQDYFGLDYIELGRAGVIVMNNGKREWIDYGMDLLEDERFKKYCQKHVNEWRAERTHSCSEQSSLEEFVRNNKP